MEITESQKVKFYLGAALMIFPLAFFMWSMFPGDLGLIAATAVSLFLCGFILLFMTVLDMKIADIEIRLIEDKKEP